MPTEKSLRSYFSTQHMPPEIAEKWERLSGLVENWRERRGGEWLIAADELDEILGAEE